MDTGGWTPQGSNQEIKGEGKGIQEGQEVPQSQEGKQAQIIVKYAK
jgi:hypothetical protein